MKKSVSNVRLKFGALFLCFWVWLPVAKAQNESWPSPEVESLYRSAQASLAAGSFGPAIASYQQAIALAPDKPVLYRDLAQAYLLSGNYRRAESTITPLIENDRADATAYAIAASIQTALHEDKKARKLLDKGLEKYPGSGFLFHEKGKYYEQQRALPEALNAWIAGIAADPGYHVNYYEAARAYMQTDEPVWAILYAEIFINLERYTPRSGETRKLLLAAYKRLYGTPDAGLVPRFGKKVKTTPTNFKEAVEHDLLHLAPVLSDGFSTENLTMLRTRFCMEWMARYAVRYPFTLFTYWDNLLRAGHFDAYNQWVFGRAENQAQYDAWVKFHPEAIPAYEQYAAKHPLLPTASDAYNPAELKGIFIKDRQR
ncbi:MAG: tetratricopeptide repeat protein [Bacteroidetes bacterium]|nr:tetratricopeptide repeat protein [Bacteroidota bacterium]